MRSFVPLLIIGALLVVYTSALECYTGYAIIRGRSVGTEKETCKKESDSCYRMTVDVNTVIKGKLAGCSTYRCSISRNTCTGQGLPGHRTEICCCDHDLCNSHGDRSTGDKVRGALDFIESGK